MLSRPDPAVWAALAIGVAAPAAVAVQAPSGIRLVLVLAFVLVVPGTALLAWFPQGDGFVRAALTVVFGMALTAGSAALMLWTGFWQPLVGLVLLAVLSVGSLALRHSVPAEVTR
ncbi:hypothetical protein [Pseudonocardia pini]|uniref:hypothetical protein n=1 Tax=Pseudonocardia pini TaxID=2758030 RepID=UPI0015F0A2DF|nr:hypothetical protein [Pseudonocardia pini]